METVKIKTDWFDRILHGGFPVRTKTIITGPGGSGKPLIGEYFIASWLESGGSVVIISLQYPSAEFIATSVKNVSGTDINAFSDQVVFIHLDTGIATSKQINKQLIHANLLKPEVWEQTIDLAAGQLPANGPGILVFASAFNLLLFSPTYGEAIFRKIRETLQSDSPLTYIITVSTSAKQEKIAELEKLADNLIVSRSEKEPFRLFMTIERMKTGTFEQQEIQIPVSAETLNHIKQIAHHSRGKVLPSIMKI